MKNTNHIGKTGMSVTNSRAIFFSSSVEMVIYAWGQLTLVELYSFIMHEIEDSLKDQKNVVFKK